MSKQIGLVIALLVWGATGVVRAEEPVVAPVPQPVGVPAPVAPVPAGVRKLPFLSWGWARTASIWFGRFARDGGDGCLLG